jgi:hypothetical protein
MTSTARPEARALRAAAARQALRLCEVDQARLTLNITGPRSGLAQLPGRQRGSRPITTRAALRAVGVPPLAAAALRRRLRLTPDQEAEL